MKPYPFFGCAVAAGLMSLAPALAEAACNALEVRFNPQGTPKTASREALSPQIAVWLEDRAGNFIADVFVTRLVGFYGLGNRPGQALLKSDFRWPIGRRPMALPIWAYRRGKTYKFVVMGGKCSTRYNPMNPADTTCPNDFQGSPSDDDSTVVYHGPVSSPEPYYCSPSGSRTVTMMGVDVVTCASAFYGPKGWYAPGYVSHYPPRADLTSFGANDHPDAMKFQTDNDVTAISGATPEVGKVLNPPILWPRPMTLADGDYVLRVEVNREADFNASWPPGKSVPEPHSEWNYLGKEFLGQPSVLYSVLFRLDATPRTALATDYAGYGDWKGDSGTINAPDMTISTANGSGADRLQSVTDADGTWRVKLKTGGCGMVCTMPAVPAQLYLSEQTDSTLTVRFESPAGDAASAYQLRYRAGDPITDANFDTAMPAPSPLPAAAGTVITTQILGLMPQTLYYVALRPINDCGMPGKLVSGSAMTAPLANSPDMAGPGTGPGTPPGMTPSGCGCFITTRQPLPGIPSLILPLLLALPAARALRRRR